MSTFWDGLERSAKTDQQFNVQRQAALRTAEGDAKTLHELVSQDKSRLEKIGVAATVDGRTVKFKKEGLEVLVVTFGIDDTGRNRIYSPILEFLKLSPAYVDVHGRDQTVELSGVWLGKSIEQFRANEDVFRILRVV